MGSIKMLMEDFSLNENEKDINLSKFYGKLYENYKNDLKQYGEEVHEIYSSLLGEELMESFKEAGTYLTEGEAEGRAMAYAAKAAAEAAKASDRNYKPPTNPFAAWAGRNLPQNKKPDVPKTVWEKIKAFGSKIPAALKGFAEKGMAFIKENPWAGVLGAIAAAGLTVMAAKKIFKKAGRKLTAEEEMELKKKLEANKKEEVKKA